jgi:acid phosphatase class B
MILILLEYRIIEENADSYWGWWDAICELEDAIHNFSLNGMAPMMNSVNLHYLLFDSEIIWSYYKEMHPNIFDFKNLNNFYFFRNLKVRICTIDDFYAWEK